MSSPSQTIPVPPGGTEPRAGREPVPVWLVVGFLCAIYWAMVYFDLHGGWFRPEVYAPYASAANLESFQPPPLDEAFPRARAKVLYEKNCELCHGSDGMGKPGQAPHYVNSDWVIGSPERLIRIPNQGLTGPIKINGQEWNQVSSMAAMGAALSDEELSYVLSYIRTSWGNKGSVITPDQVNAVRKETAKRGQPWTDPELRALPEK